MGEGWESKKLHIIFGVSRTLTDLGTFVEAPVATVVMAHYGAKNLEGVAVVEDNCKDDSTPNDAMQKEAQKVR